MKRITFFAVACTAVVWLFGAALVSCSNDDDSSSGASDTSGTPGTTTDGLETSGGTPVSDVTTLAVGTSVTMGGTEYLVTKNTFASTSSRSAVRAAETEDDIEKNLAYIQQYLDKDYRAQILKEETGIEKYVELFPKNSRKTSASGTASLLDSYGYLDENGEKIAGLGVQWKSDSSFTGFFYKVDGTEQNKTEALAAEFNKLTEDEIREYDPGIINIADVKNHKKIGITFKRLDDAENYGKVDYTTQVTRSESKMMANRAGTEREVYSIKKDKDKGTVSYQLKDNIQEGQIIVAIDTKDVSIAIRAQGDGKIAGSLSTADYKRNVIVNLYKNQPINIQDEFGDPKATRNMITGGNTNYSGDVKIKKQTYDASAKSWTDDTSSQVAISALAEGDYCVSFATETVQIGEVTVPKSVTYHAHFEKDENGNYPTKDKYAKVTCYPEYDEKVSRVVYKLTEKSIKDFFAAYEADFATLPTAAEPSGANTEDDTNVPRVTFTGTELKIELEDMATNFRLVDDADASGGKAGILENSDSYAGVIITFPAGTYTGYVWEKAPSGENDAFNVKIDDVYTRCYADDPVPDGYAKTSRTSITVSAETEKTVTLRIQQNNPNTPKKLGETGMYIDYILFTKD